MLKARLYDMGSQYDLVACHVSTGRENDSDYIEGGGVSGWNELAHEQKMELNKQRSIQRTKSKIRRYVIKNNMRYMWTLTFRKQKFVHRNKQYDVSNLEDVWMLWKAFVKRCKRAGIDFKYIATVEVQEKRMEEYGEKVYHFHFATDKNIPINKEMASKRGMKHCMMSLWVHGRVFVTKNKSKKKFANQYLVKYITKMMEETSKGSHRYRSSERLQVPVEEILFMNEAEMDVFISSLAIKRELDDLYKNVFLMDDEKTEVFFYNIS